MRREFATWLQAYASSNEKVVVLTGDLGFQALEGVRAAIGGGADIIPGTKKVGPPGASITMPIGNKDDRWVFDDMDAVDVCVPDAPRSDEILIALVLSTGGRPNARVRKPTA